MGAVDVGTADVAGNDDEDDGGDDDDDGYYYDDDYEDEEDHPLDGSVRVPATKSSDSKQYECYFFLVYR